jgi:hypothetical protein
MSNLLRIVFDVLPMFVHRQRFCAARDVLETHRHVIPNIDASVDAVARAFPVVVDVSEDLERIPAGMVPCDHRIMTQRVRLVLGAIPNFGEVRDAVPRQRQRWLQIMVADDEMLARTRKLPEQPFEVGGIFGLWSKCKVANNPEIIVWAHLGPQVFDQDGVHLTGAAERAAAERDDVLVPEMRIGCIPVGHVVFSVVRWGRAATDGCGDEDHHRRTARSRPP